MNGRRLTLASLVLATVPFFFCGLSQKASEKLAEKAIEKSTGGKVDIQQGGKKVTITNDKGESVVMGNAIPESFPKDVPIYPGATAEGGFGVTGTGTGGGTMVALKSGDDPAKLLEYYKKELPAQSWTIKTTVDSAPAGGMFICEKETRALTVMIGKDEHSGGASLMITVADKQ